MRTFFHISLHFSHSHAATTTPAKPLPASAEKFRQLVHQSMRQSMRQFVGIHQSIHQTRRLLAKAQANCPFCLPRRSGSPLTPSRLVSPRMATGAMPRSHAVSGMTAQVSAVHYAAVFRAWLRLVSTPGFPLPVFRFFNSNTFFCWQCSTHNRTAMHTTTPTTRTLLP